jgi:hypothetical protein
MPPFNAFQFNRAVWLISLCTMILVPLHAHASNAILTELLDDFVFASEVEAVNAMKKHCMAESSRDNAEHVGAILRSEDGRFMVTHGQASPGQESVAFTIRRPPALKIVALWHTHGAHGRNTQRFSIEDGNTVRDTGLPFYLIEPRGRITLLEKAEKGKSKTRAASSDLPGRKLIRISRGLALYRLQDVEINT